MAGTESVGKAVNVPSAWTVFSEDRNIHVLVAVDRDLYLLEVSEATPLVSNYKYKIGRFSVFAHSCDILNLIFPYHLCIIFLGEVKAREKLYCSQILL
jgi:hypothetical protein